MEKETSSLEKELENQNILPDAFFGTEALNSIEAQRDQILSIIQSDGFLPPDQKIILEDSRNILIRKCPPFTDNDWYLCGELAWYIFSGQRIYTIEINNRENCLLGYVTALALLADLSERENENRYDITLYVISCKDDSGIPEPINFSASPKEARFILNRLYMKMFNAHCSKCIPSELLTKDFTKTGSLAQLKNTLEDEHGNTSWKYFSKADLFDKNVHLGYTVDTFKDEWPIACKCQISDILFLNEDNNQNEEN